MLKLRCFTISWKILAHFEFDGCNTQTQKVGTGATKGWKNVGTNQKQLKRLIYVLEAMTQCSIEE